MDHYEGQSSRAIPLLLCIAAHSVNTKLNHAPIDDTAANKYILLTRVASLHNRQLQQKAQRFDTRLIN